MRIDEFKHSQRCGKEKTVQNMHAYFSQKCMKVHCIYIK